MEKRGSQRQMSSSAQRQRGRWDRWDVEGESSEQTCRSAGDRDKIREGSIGRPRRARGNPCGNLI